MIFDPRIGMVFSGTEFQHVDKAMQNFKQLVKPKTTPT